MFIAGAVVAVIIWLIMAGLLLNVSFAKLKFYIQRAAQPQLQRIFATVR